MADPAPLHARPVTGPVSGDPRGDGGGLHDEGGQGRGCEYRLTDAGHALIAVVLGLFEWGAAHLPDGGRVTGVHGDCDARVHVVLRCERGHDVAEDEVVVTDDPPER